MKGRSDGPRLSVFRSLRHVSAQLIDDARGITLASASDLELIKGKKKRLGRRERAERVGELLAEKAKTKGISRARFDRGSYLYHGLVKAVAEGARKGGLQF